MHNNDNDNENKNYNNKVSTYVTMSGLSYMVLQILIAATSGVPASGIAAINLKSKSSLADNELLFSSPLLPARHIVLTEPVAL